MNKQKKVYWNGAYYNALSKDVETFFLEGLFSVYLTEKNL